MSAVTADTPLAARLLERRRALGRPLAMGIVNATGDSFYPASRASGEAAVAAGLRLAEEGADLIDVGGESTRPGSDPVAAEEELRRVVPVVEALAGRLTVPVSIDTSKPSVARAAREAGASVLNDVLALRAPGMAAEAARFPLVVLMHMRGDSPKRMQEDPRYDDVVSEVRDFLSERLAALRAADRALSRGSATAPSGAGVPPPDVVGRRPASEALGAAGGRAWLDPGIGFGKTTAQNLELLRGLEALAGLAPVLVGASRKSFLGRLLGSEAAPLPPEERLEASLAVACRAAAAGAVCVRVHDVRATVRLLEAWKAVS